MCSTLYVYALQNLFRGQKMTKIAAQHILKCITCSGVVVVERLERSLQFLFSRVERRSSSCFSCFPSILLISCRNCHLTSVISDKLPIVICSYDNDNDTYYIIYIVCRSTVNCNTLYMSMKFSSVKNSLSYSFNRIGQRIVIC